MLRWLGELGVNLEFPAVATEISESSVALSNGKILDCGFVAYAAGGRPANWLRQTELKLESGYVVVDEFLRAQGQPNIFAAGDCAHLAESPRPNAGVFAVRQAPVLFQNLAAHLGSGALRKYHPQRDFLKLISAGGKRAVAEKHGISFGGRPIWRAKDRIDRRFIHKLSELPRMDQPRAPERAAANVREMIEEEGMPIKDSQ